MMRVKKYPMEIYKKAAKLGFTASIPEEYNGGMDCLAEAIS